MSTSSEAAQQALERRLQGMGMEVQRMPDGGCLLAHMRLQNASFETSGDPLRIDAVVLATVGSEGLKCLQPRALFQLPILPLRECRDATAIEARIHLAWQQHQARLARGEAWLRQLGIPFEREADRGQLAFSLAGTDPEARARMTEPNEVILPSRGLLSGIALKRSEDRLLPIGPRIQTSVDLEIDISNRLGELARLNDRLSQPAPQEEAEESPDRKERNPQVLLVGPRLTRESACIDALGLRGFDVASASNETEAIAHFEHGSPELVIADVQLGRSEGIDLIHSVRRVPGIEEVPVLLLDSRKREDRRDAARRMGAAGYLVYPLDIPRIADRLSRIVSDPRRRRFTRYHQRFAVEVEGATESLLATPIGRGGMFLATDLELSPHDVRSCTLALPERDTRVRVEAEVIYRDDPGLGLRFRRFCDEDEAVFLAYLRTLQP